MDFSQFKIGLLKREASTLKIYAGCLVVLLVAMGADAYFLFEEEPHRAFIRFLVSLSAFMAILFYKKTYTNIQRQIRQIEEEKNEPS